MKLLSKTNFPSSLNYDGKIVRKMGPRINEHAIQISLCEEAKDC